ncbi:hypothetical protein [Longimonas halophila]|uniref:hypothetical protein n=1 Tax=Longimonas halophila TaxID=1469170 RepID=UPI001596D31F|nr:hypothetical protein [Longimonas halophila]
MIRLQKRVARVYDRLEAFWERPASQRHLATLLIVAFAAALCTIEAQRLGWLPNVGLLGQVPTNHFYAIDVAFSLFLVFEVIGLVFGLATSVADTAGKQLEIFSLILLRQSFKELVNFEQEPIEWTLEMADAVEAVQLVVVDATGALAIFALVGGFYALQKHQNITSSTAELRRFVESKKTLAVALLVIFGGVLLYGGVALMQGNLAYPLFETIFTVFIFSDVLIVLLSLRYGNAYHVVFRNSGFAVATVMIRLALAGPRYIDAALGVGAALFAIGVTLAYNYVSPVLEADAKTRARRAALIAGPGAAAPDSEDPSSTDVESPPASQR